MIARAGWQEIAELLDITRERGECDICHTWAPALWRVVDDEPGDWVYCRACATHTAKGILRRQAEVRA